MRDRTEHTQAADQDRRDRDRDREPLSPRDRTLTRERPIPIQHSTEEYDTEGYSLDGSRNAYDREYLSRGRAPARERETRLLRERSKSRARSRSRPATERAREGELDAGQEVTPEEEESVEGEVRGYGYYDVMEGRVPGSRRWSEYYNYGGSGGGRQRWGYGGYAAGGYGYDWEGW